MTEIAIASDRLSASISTLGAELRTLRDADGRDLLWEGDPTWWTGRAPILFPTIGRVAGGVVWVDGRAYPMPLHGFAAAQEWALVAQDAASATFRLQDNAVTRVSYPFAFRLDLRFALDAGALWMTATVTNCGVKPMPASFGFHPALRWPLPYGAAKADHRIVFALPEPAPVRRIDAAGLLDLTVEPTPVSGDTLIPHASMFHRIALIFDRLESRSLHFGVPGGLGLDIAFEGLPILALWQPPGAPFLCIEPWSSGPDPADFVGEWRSKPGEVLIGPWEERRFAMRIAPGALENLHDERNRQGTPTEPLV